MLHDRDLAKAEGEAWDIADTIPLLSAMEILPAANYTDLGDSHVVVVTVGATVTPGQSRLDVLGANASVISGIMGQLDETCPGAVVILVSNPVDVLARIAIEASPGHQAASWVAGRSWTGRGYGTSSAPCSTWSASPSTPMSSASTETARSRLVKRYRRGDQARGIPAPVGASWPQIKEELTASTRARGASIHRRKGFTSYGVAAAVARIVRAVTQDEKRILHGLHSGGSGVRHRARGAQPALRGRSRRSRAPATPANVRGRAAIAAALGGHPRPGLPIAQPRRPGGRACIAAADPALPAASPPAHRCASPSPAPGWRCDHQRWRWPAD
jgi:L-lactate dehydrogenase